MNEPGPTLALANKVAIVTGGGRGIGRALALGLAERGARVVVNDLGTDLHGSGSDDSVAGAVVSEIQARGGQACSSNASIASWTGAQSVVDTALGTYGRVDILVNNAGIVRDRMVFKMEGDEWDSVLSTHLFGSFYCTRHCAPAMASGGGGSIINITSTAGLIGNYGQANYAAAKLGIVGLTRAAARELDASHIRVNGVAPWAVTRLISEVPGDVQAKRGSKAQELMPEQIVPLVTYLASDAAQGVTGRVLCVRGREVLDFEMHRDLRTVVLHGDLDNEAMERAFEALQPYFFDLDVTADVFNYEPLP